KLCSVCGYKYTELTLAEREWTCPECGTYHHRDKNASMNLKKEGIRLLEERGITVII
ncbi:MAG: zinc ribbon domain-containing protein, partial [Promethearchaeota archaeon]